MAAGGVPKPLRDEDLYDFRNMEPDPSKVPTPLETLADLETLVQQDPEDQLIDLRGLNKLRDAPSALTIMTALCWDHGWRVVGGTNSVSNASELDEELYAIEALTLPRLKLDLEDEGSQLKVIPDELKAMESLLEQVQGVREMAVSLGPGLVTLVRPLFNFVSQVSKNLPITSIHIKEISSLVEGVRNSAVRVGSEVKQTTLVSAIHALNADINYTSTTLYFFETASTVLHARPAELTKIRLQIRELTKIRFQIRAIRSSAVRLDKRVREIIKKQEGLVEAKEEKNTEEKFKKQEEEGVVDAKEKKNKEEQEQEEEGGVITAGVSSNQNIADAFRAILNIAVRMDERVRVEQKGEKEGGLKAAAVPISIDRGVAYDLREIRLQLQAIRNSAVCLDEQVQEEMKRQEEEYGVEAEKKKEEGIVEPAGSDP